MVSAKNSKPHRGKTVEQLIKELQTYDSSPFDRHSQAKQEKKLQKIERELVAFGEGAIPSLIEVLHHQKQPSFAHATSALALIQDERAIKPLVMYLENTNFGEDCKNALVAIGPACVPEVIKKVEFRIAHPVEVEDGFISKTNYPLSTIGEIRCDQSAAFLNNLLDKYMKEMPTEAFDPTQYEWPYRNVDLFHLLDCMVRQQNESSIPHIKKAQQYFPREYTEYLICQIAMGRIKKKKVEGYLPLEALEITMPSSAIMDMFLGREKDRSNDFMDEYGEYFEEDD